MQLAPDATHVPLQDFQRPLVYKELFLWRGWAVSIGSRVVALASLAYLAIGKGSAGKASDGVAAAIWTGSGSWACTASACRTESLFSGKRFVTA